MKKSTIWLIAIIMGVSFLTLLYLQTKYFEEVLKIRKEQFDESVSRSLYQTARNLELNETRTGLEEELRKGNGKAATDLKGSASNAKGSASNAKDSANGTDAAAGGSNAPGSNAKTQGSNSKTQGGDARTAASDAGQTGSAPTPFEIRTHTTTPSSVPKGLFLNATNGNSDDETLRDSVRQRYIYQRALLNEVVYSILYKTSDKPLAQRIDFSNLDSDLRAELRSNGINIDYHFYVTTSDGRLVYRCSDYTSEGEEFNYKQVLYPNDPTAQMGLLYIHFPKMRSYIFASVKFMIPAIIFTLVLLVVFIFTIYTIFRQKRLTEIKNDFINNMTHEFKTPISTISLAAQMLKDPAVAKSDAMFKHISGIIIDETKRLRFQVEKVLQMSMFDKKAATFKRKEVDANVLIQDTVNTFRLKVEASGGSIEAHLDAENAIVFVDEMHFTNVIFNLLDNAVKYKSDDRALHLNVTTHNEQHRLVVGIEDNGIGIKREDLKRIFDKFFRVHTGNRHDVKGFGLGLAYVHRIIQASGGNITAESEYGKGTRFIITLPLMN